MQAVYTDKSQGGITVSYPLHPDIGDESEAQGEGY